MTTPTPALRLDDVTVRYRDGDDLLTVLDGLHLEVAPGEVVAIAGRSGSGKSTLLAVAGLLRTPDSGRVHIDGTAAEGLRPAARTRLRRERVAVVHQSSQLFPSLRAVEQLELVAHLRGRLDRAARVRARELLDTVGLGSRMRHLPARLSGGERQRVEIARALMAEPAVILADEPTSALDPHRAREIVELLASEARRRAIATVVVVHDPDLADVADCRLTLRDGTLAAGSV